MKHKIVFSTAKGGVGKSTLTVTTAAGLKERGYKVLVIDMDCQGSASSICGIDIDSDIPTLKAVLDGDKTLKEVIVNTPYGDIVPNNLLLFNSDRIYNGLLDLKKLKKAIATIQDEYDYVLFDCMPSFSFLTLSALIDADYVIVPQLASSLSGHALSQLRTMLSIVQEEENPNLKILGIVLVRWNPRTRFSKDFLDVLSAVAKEIDAPIFDSKIRQSVTVEEAISVHQPIFDYAPEKMVTKDYDNFVTELLQRLEEEDK